MNIYIVGVVGSAIFGFREGLLRELVRRGYNVTVMVGDASPELIFKARREIGVNVKGYSISRGGLNPFRDLITFISLYIIFKKSKPDVVFSYLAKPCIYASLAARAAGVGKVFAMLEGMGFFFTETPRKDGIIKIIIRRIMSVLYRVSLPRCNAVFVLNEDDRMQVSSIVRERKVPIRNLGPIGVDIQGRFGYSEAEVSEFVTFLFVGRFLREKGVFEFLDAAHKLCSEYSNVRFFLLGDTDEQNPGALRKEDLMALAKGEVFSFPGRVDNIESWYAKSDVFVLPSYREGFSCSTQEAMSVGRAIITSDAPGCKDSIEHGRNGFIVSRFSAHEIYLAMKKFVDNPQLIVQMGNTSRRIAEDKFDSSAAAIKLVDAMELS